ICCEVKSDAHSGLKDDALSFHLLDPSFDKMLLHLEIGNAVGQKASDAVVTLEESHIMSRPCQLLGCGKPCRAGSNDSHLLTRLARWGLRGNPTFIKGAISGCSLDQLYGHRLIIDPQDTSGLAGCGADSARHLRKVVGGVQRFDRLTSQASIVVIVPIRDQIAEGAPRIAKRDSAIHASRSLTLDLLLNHGEFELLVVVDPLSSGKLSWLDASVLEEPCILAHDFVRIV